MVSYYRPLQSPTTRMRWRKEQFMFAWNISPLFMLCVYSKILCCDSLSCSRRVRTQSEINGQTVAGQEQGHVNTGYLSDSHSRKFLFKSLISLSIIPIRQLFMWHDSHSWSPSLHLLCLLLGWSQSEIDFSSSSIRKVWSDFIYFIYRTLNIRTKRVAVLVTDILLVVFWDKMKLQSVDIFSI